MPTIGLTTMLTVQILYGILLTRRKKYIDHPITRRFHVRVLIPCYSESLEIVSATALAARRATLPPGVRRTGISLSVRIYNHQKGRPAPWGQAYKHWSVCEHVWVHPV